MAKRTTESLFTAAQELEVVIGADLARHFIEHRRALKKPMTPYAASLMAKKLRGFVDPVEAVNRAILKGWLDVYPEDAAKAGRVGNDREARKTELRNQVNQGFDFGPAPRRLQ